MNLIELKDTVIKLLLRCAYGYECLERIAIIFKLHKRHKKIAASLGIIVEDDESQKKPKSRGSSKSSRRSDQTKSKSTSKKEKE